MLEAKLPWFKVRKVKTVSLLYSYQCGGKEGDKELFLKRVTGLKEHLCGQMKTVLGKKGLVTDGNQLLLGHRKSSSNGKSMDKLFSAHIHCFSLSGSVCCFSRRSCQTSLLLESSHIDCVTDRFSSLFLFYPISVIYSYFKNLFRIFHFHLN